MNAPPRNRQFAQLQFGPHLQDGPQLQTLGLVAQLQIGEQVQGLHLQILAIDELLCSVCGVHELQEKSSV